MLFFDPVYLLFLMPGLILAGVAAIKVKSTFARYKLVRSRSNMTGAEAAEALLASRGIYDVTIKRVSGFLSDHYNPVDRSLNLSPEVYSSPSLSAIGVACHEAGHALQHAEGYGPLSIRTALVPITQFGSTGSYLFFIGGMVFHSPGLLLIGVALFSFAVIFSFVTLPVEWNASSRAKELMVLSGIVTPDEERQAAAVLDAAFLTYVASAVTALLTLLYYLFRLGLLGGNDD